MKCLKETQVLLNRRKVSQKKLTNKILLLKSTMRWKSRKFMLMKIKNLNILERLFCKGKVLLLMKSKLIRLKKNKMKVLLIKRKMKKNRIFPLKKKLDILQYNRKKYKIF